MITNINYDPYELYKTRINDLKELILSEFDDAITIDIEYDKKREPVGGSGISKAPHGRFDQINVTFDNKHLTYHNRYNKYSSWYEVKVPYKLEILFRGNSWYVIVPASRNLEKILDNKSSQDIPFTSKQTAYGFREYITFRYGHKIPQTCTLLSNISDQVGYAVVEQKHSWENSVILGYHGNDYSNNTILNVIKEMIALIQDTPRSRLTVINEPLP